MNLVVGEWEDGWIDGQIDGWMEEQTDKQADKYTQITKTLTETKTYTLNKLSISSSALLQSVWLVVDIISSSSATYDSVVSIPAVSKICLFQQSISKGTGYPV